MKDEDKIYGLVAQAEEIQQHAVHLQQEAKNAVAEIGYVMSEVQGCILKADMLRALFFVGVALVVVLAVTVATAKGLGWYVAEKRAELAELKDQAAAWEQKAGKAKFNTCGEAKRLCVRVVEKPGVFRNDGGKGKEAWMIIDGY